MNALSTPALAFDATAPLRDLHQQRTALMAWLNDPTCTDYETIYDSGILNGIEQAVAQRTASTPIDAVVKMLLVCEIVAGGFEVEDTEAARAIVEAQRHFGLGFVHDALLEEAGVRPGDRLSASAEWDAAWNAHEAALAADVEVDARHAAALADKSITPALEQEWEDSGTRAGDAQWALFHTPAPNLSAVLWKMNMLAPRGLSFDDDIAATLIGDVIRLGGEA